MSVEAQWMAMPQNKLESLVASTLEKIKTILARRGGYIRWWFFEFSISVSCLGLIVESLIERKDVERLVYTLICISKCQILKIQFLFDSLFVAL